MMIGLTYGQTSAYVLYTALFGEPEYKQDRVLDNNTSPPASRQGAMYYYFFVYIS